MTLAVIAKYPWPELLAALPPAVKAALEVIPTRPRDTILLAADSRWSWKIGEVYDDGGVKLASLDSHIGAIYAGSTGAGEEALTQLSVAFAKARDAGRDAYVEPERILHQVWRRHQRPGHALQFCLGGFFGSAKEPIALRFDSESEFRPKPIESVEAIGWPQAIVYFRRRLNEEVARESAKDLSREALALSPDHWCAILGRLLLETAASDEGNEHKTVGAPIQAAIVTRSGMEGRSLYSVRLQGNQPTGRCLTLSDDDVAAFYKRHSRKAPQKLPVSRGGSARP